MTENMGAPLEAIAASLRRERQRRGLSLAEVARQAGIAKSTLSQLESGGGNPSVETLWALGVALGVPFAQLVDPPRPTVQLVRAGDGVRIYSEAADYAATLLSASPPGSRRDIYLIDAEPGKPRESEPHMAGVVEHVVLMSGRAVVGPTDEAVEIEPGDYLVYPGDVTHVFKATRKGTRAILVSEHR